MNDYFINGGDIYLFDLFGGRKRKKKKKKTSYKSYKNLRFGN